MDKREIMTIDQLNEFGKDLDIEYINIVNYISRYLSLNNHSTKVADDIDKIEYDIFSCVKSNSAYKGYFLKKIKNDIDQSNFKFEKN